MINNRTFATSRRARIIRIPHAFEFEWAWGRVCFIDSHSFSRQAGNAKIVLRGRPRRYSFRSTPAYMWEYTLFVATCNICAILSINRSRLEKVLERGRREEIKIFSSCYLQHAAHCPALRRRFDNSRARRWRCFINWINSPHAGNFTWDILHLGKNETRAKYENKSGRYSFQRRFLFLFSFLEHCTCFNNFQYVSFAVREYVSVHKYLEKCIIRYVRSF